MKAEDVQLTKTLRAQPRGKTGRKLALSNRDLPDGVHEKDRWHKNFIPTFLWWVGQQQDPWNLPDDEVITALQQIWNVVYKKIPYTVEPKDAVVAVVCIIFVTCHDTYKSYRPCNVSVTRGALRLVPRLFRSSILSSKIVMTTS